MAVSPEATRAAQTLDELYREHVSAVYRYTLAVLGNRADAEDVTQTTFVNALRALERGERPRKPGNWLIAIAHNLIRQRFRHDRARPTEVALEIDVPGPAADESDAPSVDELLRALARIAPSQRTALVMREFEGRSYAEIAEILDMTTNALETLLFRARRSLAEELENLVTCERAEQDLSRLLDGRLTRKQRRRLEEHLSACPSCARFRALQHKQRTAFKGLALLPLPLSLTTFHGTPSAAAATLPTIAGGAVGAVGAVTGTTAAGGAASAGGGLVLGGVVGKVAAIVAAATVAGGVGYAGVQEIRVHTHPVSPAHGAPVSTADRASERGGGQAGAQRVSPATSGQRGRAARGTGPGTAAPANTRRHTRPTENDSITRTRRGGAATRSDTGKARGKTTTRGGEGSGYKANQPTSGSRGGSTATTRTTRAAAGNAVGGTTPQQSSTASATAGTPDKSHAAK